MLSSVSIAIPRCHLKLRTTIDRDAGTSDPARTVGRYKSDYVGDVLGFADSLQCLHSQCDLATRFCLRKIRHVRVDYFWCNGIYAYAARPENGGPVLNQSLNCSLSRGVGKDRRVFQTGLAPTVRAVAEETRTMFERSPRTRRSCCTKKNGLRTFVAKRLSKSSTV